MTDQVSHLRGCAENSVTTNLRCFKLQQERRYHSNRGGSLNSRISLSYHLVLGLRMSDSITHFPLITKHRGNYY